MIEVVYSPTYAEFCRAAQLDRKVNPSNRLFHLLMSWIAPGVGIFTILVFAGLRVIFGTPIHVSFMGGVILAMTLLAPFYEQWSVRAQFKNMFPAKAADRKLHAEIGEEGISLTVLGGAQSRYPWSMFVNSIRAEDVVLLYANKTRFIFLPLSALTSGQREELDDLMKRRGVKTWC